MWWRFFAIVLLLCIESFAVSKTASLIDNRKAFALGTAIKRYIEETKRNAPKPVICPHGQTWYSFGKSCYLVISEKQTHRDAALTCLIYGSKLVEIETQEENDFLKRILYQGSYWTGGTDAITENRWVWPMTGNPITQYYDWRVGEPNDALEGEDCLQFYSNSFSKTWNDNKCNTAMAFVCERSAILV